MFDLTILDYIYVGIILASTVWATIRGGVYETVATLSWVAAAVIARFTSPILDGWIVKLFKLSDSTVGTLVASYFLVIVVILLITGFVNQKLRDRIQESMMNVTDHTLGVIFGIIRGVIVMGITYWVMLWYFSDMPHTRIPHWFTDARTRPIMQMTADKIDKWFVPGPENKLLARDIAGTHEAAAIYDNLINPRVADQDKSDVATPTVAPAKTPQEKPAKESEQSAETGYKSSERAALENQLVQIGAVARVIESRENDTESK